MLLYLVPIGLLTLAGIFVTIGIILLQKEKRIRNSTQYTYGEVVSYSASNSMAPIVAYWVDGKKYRKALRYSFVITTSSPRHQIEATTEDLLAPMLHIRKNSVVSYNDCMRRAFPLYHPMKVYYHVDDPKAAYVERYAKSWLHRIFLLSGLVLGIVAIILLKVLDN